MRWVLVIKDHATALVYLCALPRKCPNLVANKLQEIFGIIGFPKIFHTDNEKEFTAKVVLMFLRQMNPNITTVTGRPLCPSDQGSVEDMNKLVKRFIGSVLTERRLVGDNPIWTEVLGSVAAVINSQHGRKKDEVSSYEAVYGQEFNHKVSCSEEEAHWCWTLPQLLKITNNTEFSDYVSLIYHLDDGSAADDEDDNGYFSDEMLPEDERDEVTDENFLKHLVTPNSLGVNDGSAADDEDDDGYFPDETLPGDERDEVTDEVNDFIPVVHSTPNYKQSPLDSEELAEECQDTTVRQENTQLDKTNCPSSERLQGSPERRCHEDLDIMDRTTATGTHFAKDCTYSCFWGTKKKCDHKISNVQNNHIVPKRGTRRKIMEGEEETYKESDDQVLYTKSGGHARKRAQRECNKSRAEESPYNKVFPTPHRGNIRPTENASANAGLINHGVVC
jgi:hypothetical protein